MDGPVGPHTAASSSDGCATAETEVRDGLRTRTLELAVAAGRLGGVGRAASAAGLSPPSVAKAVADLEAFAGAPLFKRDGRGIRPTEAGKEVLERAEAILADLEDLERAMAALAPDRSGAVTLGLPPSVSGILVPALVRAARAVLPDTRLRVVESYSGAVQRALLDGTFDVGVVYAGQPVSGMPTEPMLTERLVLVGPAGEGRLAAGSIRLAEALALPLVLPGPEHGMRRLVDREARRADLTVNVVLEVDAMLAAIELCEEDGCFTILPSCAVERAVRRGEVTAVPIVDPPLVRGLALATTTARPASLAVRAVARLVLDTARRLAAEGRWLAWP